ncbi:MAG: hypothetical protein CHACPFDD_02349 [Phycisphaerae bacterium]|nr:hypothetical protein [Phycisphaerae bacterium]
MRLRRKTIISLLAGTCCCLGCAPQPLPGPEEINDVLSGILLDPAKSCERLRDDFRLYFLTTVDTPDQAGLDYLTHWVLKPDGTVLQVWYLPANLDRGTIVLSNGAAGNKACYLFVARLFVYNGWSVFTYDYQGFGESEGQASLASMPDDLNTVVDWARRLTGRDKVTLAGISIGSIPSIAVAAARPDAVNGLILDSPVALDAELDRFNAIIGGQANEVVRRLDPTLISDAVIRNVTQPILILASQRDFLTPPTTVQRLADRAAGPVSLVRFDGIDHALGPYLRTAEYVFQIENFLTGVWSNLAAAASRSASD